MTTDPLFVTDLDAAALNLRPGAFPRTLEWDDRVWIRDRPKLSPEGDVEAYQYTVKGQPDFPEVLCVWGVE